MVVLDPAGPVDLVKEPVHDDEQDGDRDEAGGSLHVESAAAERAEEPRGDEPRDHRDRQPNSDADPHRLGTDRVGAPEARKHGREHEDRLQPFPQHEQGAVEDDRAVAEVRCLGRVGDTAAGGQSGVQQQPATNRGEHDPRAPAEAGLIGDACRLMPLGHVDLGYPKSPHDDSITVGAIRRSRPKARHCERWARRGRRRVEAFRAGSGCRVSSRQRTRRVPRKRPASTGSPARRRGRARSCSTVWTASRRSTLPEDA